MESPEVARRIQGSEGSAAYPGESEGSAAYPGESEGSTTPCPGYAALPSGMPWIRRATFALPWIRRATFAPLDTPRYPGMFMDTHGPPWSEKSRAD